MTEWKPFAAVCFALLSIAGCTTIPNKPPKVEPPPGHQRVVPTGYAVVGRIYRKGIGERPWLLLDDSTVYSEICWNDFLETAALKTIQEHVVAAQNVIHPSATSTLSLKLSAGFSGSVAGAATGISGSAEPSATYSLSNLRLVTLTDTGRRIIESEIGESCRELIRKHGAEGVILLAEGLRADSGKQTAGIKIDLKPSVGPVSTGFVTDANSEITSSNVLVSARLNKL
jgi:hypothetical protein